VIITKAATTTATITTRHAVPSWHSSLAKCDPDILQKYGQLSLSYSNSRKFEKMEESSKPQRENAEH